VKGADAVTISSIPRLKKCFGWLKIDGEYLHNLPRTSRPISIRLRTYGDREILPDRTSQSCMSISPKATAIRARCSWSWTSSGGLGSHSPSRLGRRTGKAESLWIYPTSYLPWDSFGTQVVTAGLMPVGGS
jgi:hypothetical protein